MSSTFDMLSCAFSSCGTMIVTHWPYRFQDCYLFRQHPAVSLLIALCCRRQC